MKSKVKMLDHELAYLQQEPGGDVVDGMLGDSVMASVNWAKVV